MSHQHMSLSPGSRLGPYEILAPIGAGGMTETEQAGGEPITLVVNWTAGLPR